MIPRNLKVARTMRDAIAEIFIRCDLGTVAVHNVRMSPDLKYAFVEVGSLDEKISDEEILKLVDSKNSLIKRELRNYINLKYFPNIIFSSDQHKDRIAKMEELMAKL